MNGFVSIIIPNRNGAPTLGRCLQAACAARYPNFEIIVVDDASTDASVRIARRYACRLVRLPRHRGAAYARNVGAAYARGDVLFFTDADCVLAPDSLSIAVSALRACGTDAVVGGTYATEPWDNRFFSAFQAVFVNYSETKHAGDPDYVATHAMAIAAQTFRRFGGFDERMRPILEDVEFSHRLRRGGCRLCVEPRLTVRHIFNFSLAASLRNAVRKSMYWTAYSIRRRDVLRDSGTASVELKTNVAAFAAAAAAVLAFAWSGQAWPLLFVAPVYALNLAVNKRLFAAFHRAKGPYFAAAAALYYLCVYPAAVAAGTLAGVMRHVAGVRAFTGAA